MSDVYPLAYPWRLNLEAVQRIADGLRDGRLGQAAQRSEE